MNNSSGCSFFIKKERKCKNEKDVFLIVSRFFYCSSFFITFVGGVSANEIYDNCANSGSVLSDLQVGGLPSEKYFSRENMEFFSSEENKGNEDCFTGTEIKEVVFINDYPVGGRVAQFVTHSSESEGERMSEPTPINDEDDLIKPFILSESPESDLITTFDLIPGEDEKEVLQDIRDIMELLNDRFNFGSNDLNPNPMDGNWVTFFRMLKNDITSSIQVVEESLKTFKVYAVDGAPNQYDGNFVKMIRFEAGRINSNITSMSAKLDPFNVMVSNGEPRSSDGNFVKMIRYEVDRLYNPLSTFSRNFDPFTVMVSNGEPRSTDGNFVKMIRYEVGRVLSPIDSMSRKLDPFYVALSNSLPNDSDGGFVKMIRYEVARILTPLNDMSRKLDPFNVMVNTGEPRSSDGNFVKMIRYEVDRLYNPLSTFSRNFDPFTVMVNTGEPRSTDGNFVKMIRYEVSRIVSPLDSISRSLEQFYVQIKNGEPRDSDGAFVRMVRYEVNRIVNAISGGSAGAGESEVIPLLEDILDELEKFGDGFNEESGASIWDFLMNFTDNLFEMIEFLVEKIIYLVIPEDSTDILNGFDMLAESFKSKMEPAGVMKTELTNSMMVQEKDFESIRVSLPIYGEVMLFDPTYLLEAIPKIKAFLSGLMIIITGTWAFRKINSGVLR